MITGTTATGFNYEIDPEVFDDMDFIDLACEVDDRAPEKLGTLYSLALGDDQYKALKAHVKERCGRAKVSEVKKEMDEIFDAVKEDPDAKN